jgi:DNA polymerase-4
MIGHGRVLPPDYRRVEQARSASRLLIVKAARRVRREGWNAGRLWLWLDIMHADNKSTDVWLPAVHDDHAILGALDQAWEKLRPHLSRRVRIIRLGVTLLELTLAKERQLDILLNDDRHRRRCEDVTAAIDKINRKHGKTLVHIGTWVPPPGGYAGGKISYTRIPRAEDFW